MDAARPAPDCENAPKPTSVTWADGEVRLRDPRVFGPDAADPSPCARFLGRVLGLDEVRGVTVDRAEATALVRHCSRLFVATAALDVPLIAIVLRKAYGLGAQAMAGGSMHEPLLTVGWPSAELGAMGLEGAVRLGFRRELEEIPEGEQREQRIRGMTEAAHEHAKALNAATLFEIDDVIDPAETRGLIARTLAAATPGEAQGWRTRPAAARRPVDTW